MPLKKQPSLKTVTQTQWKQTAVGELFDLKASNVPEDSWKSLLPVINQSIKDQ